MFSFKKGALAALSLGALAGLLAGSTMVGVAWNRGPENPVRGAELGIAWGYLVKLGGSWSLLVGIPLILILLALAALSTVWSKK